MLQALHRDPAARQVQLLIVECHASVRDTLRAIGLEKQVGCLGRHISVHQAIDEFFDERERSESADSRIQEVNG